jgi:hypothetical protein
MNGDEADFPAKQSPAQAQARFSGPDENEGRAGNPEGPKGQGPNQALGLKNA